MWIHRKGAELSSTKWAGGETNELIIYPFDASYADRNFIFRISTAKVKVPNSTFTSLSGFQRSLMVLNGHLILNHEGHHSAELHPFDVNVFRGEWKTTSQGIATDFNVMTSDLATHKITYQTGMRGEAIQFLTQNNTIWNAIYILSGALEFSSSGSLAVAGDFLLFKPEPLEELAFALKENSTWVLVTILIK